jgi:outer membrane receptor protein involved in Fe transport
MNQNKRGLRDAIRLQLVAGLAASAPGMIIGTASAQAPAAGPIPRVAALEEVVVTSRKRGEEKLQDLPATITALSGSQLEALGAIDFDQFAYLVPGLTFQDEGAGQKRYIMRGVRSAGQEQVAVYYDEVPVPGIQSASGDSGSQTTDLKLFDLERIEALKGPQGTTFGANSQSGTVRFITSKPRMDDVESRVKLGASAVNNGDEGGNFYGMFNAPLVEDRLAVRAVAYFDREGGYVDNVRLGVQDMNWRETTGFRALLRFMPREDITIDAMAWIEERDIGGSDRYNPFDSFSDSPDNPDFRANDLTPLTDIRNISFFRTGDLLNGDYTRTEMPDDQNIYSLTLNWDLDWSTLVATGSFYERDFAFKRDSTWVLLRLGVRPEPEDADDPPAVRPDFLPALTDQTQDIEQKAFEIRLNSKPGPAFQWLAGYFNRERESSFRSYVPVVDPVTGRTFDPGFPPTGFIGPVPNTGIEGCLPCVTARVNDRSIDEQAFFGELSYAITDQVEVMAGARWFEVEQSDLGLTTFPFTLFTTPPPPAADPRQFSENETLTKFQVSYKATDNVLFYALASQGFRLGGTNQQGIVAVPLGYRSDEIWNYELAAKTRLFDGRMLFNVALFDIDWKDIQVSGRDPTGAFGFLGNAGAAEIQGIELDVQSQLTDAFSFTLNASHLVKHELTEDQITDEVVAPGRAGDELPFVPDFTAGATAQYRAALPVSGWEGSIIGEYAYRGESNSEFSTASRFNRIQHDYSIVNLRAGVFSMDQGLDIVFYVNNVFDKRGDLRVRDEDSLLTFKWTIDPRTTGIDIVKRF